MDFRIKKWMVRFRSLTRIPTKLIRANYRHDRITLYEILVVFFRKLNDDEILDRANGVAFSFTLAIFPAIIFLFTLVPYIHQLVPEVNNQIILEFLSQWIPTKMFSIIETTIDDIVGSSRGGLLTFGAIFALFLASNGTMALMNAFNSIYKTKENRTWIRMRMIATGLTIILAITTVFSVILLIIGQIVLGVLSDRLEIQNLPFDINQVLLLRFLVLFIVFGFSISMLYYFAPAVHYKWQFFSLGSIFATLASLAISYVFSFYVANFATYNKVYGSIGVMIAMMVWLYLISVVLLVGYCMNASIHTVQYLHKIESIKKTTKRPKLVSTPISV